MADPARRAALFESSEHAAVIVSGITREQVTVPTPCPDDDVAALIDHLAEAASRAARHAGPFAWRASTRRRSRHDQAGVPRRDGDGIALRS